MPTSAVSPEQTALAPLLRDIETERCRYNSRALIRKPLKFDLERWLNSDKGSITRTYVRRTICCTLKTIYHEIGPEVLLLLLSIRSGSWFTKIGQQMDLLLDRLKQWWYSADKPPNLTEEAKSKGPGLHEKIISAIAALDIRVTDIKTKRATTKQQERLAATSHSQALREPQLESNTSTSESLQVFESGHVQQEMHELAPVSASSQLPPVHLPAAAMNSHVLGVDAQVPVSTVFFQFGDPLTMLPMQGYAYDASKSVAESVVQNNQFRRIQIFWPFYQGNPLMVIELLSNEALPILNNREYIY